MAAGRCWSRNCARCSRTDPETLAPGADPARALPFLQPWTSSAERSQTLDAAFGRLYDFIGTIVGLTIGGFVIAMEISLLTPPFGLLLIELLVMMVLAIFPAAALWLPGLLR